MNECKDSVDNYRNVPKTYQKLSNSYQTLAKNENIRKGSVCMHASMHLQHTRPDVAAVCCLACIHAVSSGAMADVHNVDKRLTFDDFESFSRHFNNTESRYFASHMYVKKIVELDGRKKQL